jgi:hypothetical protein
MPTFDLPAVRVRRGERVAPLLTNRIGFAALVSVITVYYLFLLSNGTFELFAPELLGTVFDNMLVHLLHGEFNVDRNVIDFEAFTRNGKTYAYFGVFPALLRLVAMPFTTNIAHVELARLSCLTAVVIFVALQLRMLLIVHISLPPESRASDLLAVMMAATALSGPQLYILGSASIYHEPILWSAAMAAAFNLIVVRAALDGVGLCGRDLVSLAVLAGLAILTRPTIGVALYLGTVLLVGWTARCRHASRCFEGPCLAKGRRLYAMVPALTDAPNILLPFAVLSLFALAAGVVNFERWGNPFTFADFRYYDWGLKHANFAEVLHNYGELSRNRIWIGALYYATGIPYVVKGIPPFAGFLNARVAGIEAPPITPFLTNPITVFLAGVGLYSLWRKPQLPAGGAAILRLTLVGHASAVILVCAAMYFTFRFRFDFSPFMTLAALAGYRSFSMAVAECSETRRKRLRIAAIGLCVLGILGSHYMLLLHKVWSFAVPMKIRLALLPFAPFAHAAFAP